jgi:hypothetical protein
MKDESRFLVEREERRMRRRRIARIVLFILVLAAALGGGWWTLFRSPVFRVDDVIIAGTKRIPLPELETRVEEAIRDSRFAGILGTRNMLVWPEGRFTAVSDAVPLLAELWIEKSYRDHRITLVAQEREPYGVWCLKKHDPPQCYWIDKSGYVLEPSPEFEGNIVSTMSDYATDEVREGEFLPVERFMGNIVSIFRALAASGVSVREVRYEKPERQELVVKLYEGPDLLFSLRFGAEPTAAALLDLKAKDSRGELAPRFRDLEYVDFRVENRVYYK